MDALRRCPVDDPNVPALLDSLVDPPFNISVLRRCVKDWLSVTPRAEEVALAMAVKAKGTADPVELEMVYQLLGRRPAAGTAAAVYLLLYGLHRAMELVLHILRDVGTEEGTVLLLVLGASLCRPRAVRVNGPARAPVITAPVTTS